MHMSQAFYQQLAQKKFNVVFDQQIALSSTSNILLRLTFLFCISLPGQQTPH